VAQCLTPHGKARAWKPPGTTGRPQRPLPTTACARKMERHLKSALLRIVDQAVPIVRAGNLARVAALRDPPTAARAQIEAAGESFRRFANG